MGDQDTQTQQERSWWVDGSPEELPPFDQPLEWPDATAWEQLFEGGPPTEPAYVPQDLDAGLAFPEAPQTAPDDGDGGLPTQAELAPLPRSIWAPDAHGRDDEEAGVAATVAALGGSGTAVADPTPTAGPDSDAGRRAGPAWLQRFHIRHGSAAVVALACCVSLVLFGMFLSVRARQDLPTETSDFQPTGTQVATEASTVPPPTTSAPTTTAAPPSTLSLADLIPADAAPAGATGGTGATTGGTTTPATTAAPSRSAAPSGGTGSSGTGSAQPTNTTAAPAPEPTSPPPTDPPPQDTTTTPTVRRPPTTIDFDFPRPSITFPSIPTSTPGNQPSSLRTSGN